MRALCSIGLVAILSWSVVGCSDDDDVVGAGPDDGDGPTVPTSPSEWLDAFEAAWGQRDAQVYADLLHPLFVFRLAPADVDAIGLAPTWDRTTELEAFAGLFSDSTGTGPPVEFFRILEIDLDGQWTEDLAPDVAPQADVRAVLALRATADFGADSRDVAGLQRMYLARESTMVDGQAVDSYRLVAWDDLGVPGSRGPAARANDTISWTALKAMVLPAR